MMKGAAHRLTQGARALFVSTASLDLDLARRHLNACEYAAFTAMAPAEQQHSLKVLSAVLAADPAAPPALTAAALLHDVGKSRCRLALWQKTLSVLANAVAPRISQRLGRDDRAGFWRAPFYVSRRHPKWSGDILRKCGSDERVIWLAENHQAAPERFSAHPLHPLLLQLQRADSAN